jgi:hypothetical protein
MCFGVFALAGNILLYGSSMHTSICESQFENSKWVRIDKRHEAQLEKHGSNSALGNSA